MEDVYVTMFRGLRFTKPKEVVLLKEVLQKISSDTWKDRVLKCREDLKKKEYLPVFTPTGIFTHRSIAGLATYNGIVYLDIDRVSSYSELTVEKLKQLCREIPWVHSAYITPSGDGMKVFVQTLATVETYREIEEQVAKKFFALTGTHRDPRCKDIARIHYISYDPDIWINPSPETFQHEPLLQLELELPL